MFWYIAVCLSNTNLGCHFMQNGLSLLKLQFCYAKFKIFQQYETKKNLFEFQNSVNKFEIA